MLYFDTSFLTPLFLEEATSTRVGEYLLAQPAGTLCTSQLARLEFSSLLAREVRMGNLSGDAALAVDRQFEEVLREAFQIISPTGVDFETAKKFVNQYTTGLRSGDALHLAVARNRQVECVLTLDKGMLKAGQLLDIPVSLGIEM